MEENELNITFEDQQTKWQFMELLNSEKGMSFLIKNDVDVSYCSTCEKGEPKTLEDFGESGYMEFKL